MIRLYTLFFLLVFVLSSFGQNEFYNAGTIVYVNGRVSTSTATLRVNGTITNNDGAFTNNAGLIELTKDWTNTSTTNNYVSTGIERFTGTSDQTIFGKWNGTASNQNQFYDLKIDKSSSTGENIILDDGVSGNIVNINAAGTLAFESTNGVIRTQSSSVGTSDITSTGDYLNKLYLQNPDPSKFTGYSTGSGATTKFIEGKLQLEINGANNYYFPVGVKPTLLGGMNAFNLNIASISASTAVVGFVKLYSTALVTSDYTFCDVAQVDNNPATPNYFSSCIGPPDGIIDLMKLTNHASHSWDVTPQVAPASVTYDIDVYPSTNMDASATFTGIPCGPYTGTGVKYLARNGVPGGNLATLASSPAFGRLIGYYMCITGNSLASQTGFSNFQLWGADDNNTNLPVELTALRADAINNEYIKVSWTTASELNNKGFVLQRSMNGAPFDSIAWIPGNGTSNTVHHYFYDDHNAEKGIIYYYRLKQVDFNNHTSLSRTVSARLIPAGIESISVYPNPSSAAATVQILSPGNEEYKLDIFNDIGQNMYSNNVKVTANNLTTVDLPTEALASGMYIIKVQSEKKQVKGIKFIKE